MTNVTDLDEHRHRRAVPTTDAIPSEIEWQAWAFAQGEGAPGRARRILHHPDLAARLCKPPLGYAEPRQWCGFIPPRDCVGGGYNDSPQRRALVEMCAAAWRLENQQTRQEAE